MDAHRLHTAARLANIRAFHVMELAKQARELELAGRSIIHMGIGEPDFTAAEPVVQAAADAMRRGVTQYTGALGIRSLRQAIARYYHTVYGLDIAPERIIVTAGASAALLLACAVLVEIGGEVLMPDPSYPCNRHFVAAFNGEAKLVPSGPEERFQLTAAQVETHWGERTQGVLLASPSNPTGTSILPDELQRIVQAVRARGGFSIVDEIYQGLSYDQAPVSALSFGDDVVTINSFSKYFNMTGWRLGWLVVPEGTRDAFSDLVEVTHSGVAGFVQRAGIAAMEQDGAIERFRAHCARGRELVGEALAGLNGVRYAAPPGAFYAFAGIDGLGDSFDLAMKLVTRHGVAVAPGIAFGSAGEGSLRICFAQSEPLMVRAMQRLRDGLRAEMGA